MSTLEERVAFLEGRVEEHARGVDGIREALVHLEERMDRRFEAVDTRFNAIDQRFDALSESLDIKIVRLVVIQVTTLAAILAAAGGILAEVTR